MNVACIVDIQPDWTVVLYIHVQHEYYIQTQCESIGSIVKVMAQSVTMNLFIADYCLMSLHTILTEFAIVLTGGTTVLIIICLTPDPHDAHHFLTLLGKPGSSL